MENLSWLLSSQNAFPDSSHCPESTAEKWEPRAWCWASSGWRTAGMDGWMQAVCPMSLMFPRGGTSSFVLQWGLLLLGLCLYCRGGAVCASPVIQDWCPFAWDSYECCTLSMATVPEDTCSFSSCKSEKKKSQFYLEHDSSYWKRNQISANKCNNHDALRDHLFKACCVALLLLRWAEMMEVLFSRNLHLFLGVMAFS